MVTPARFYEKFCEIKQLANYVSSQHHCKGNGKRWLDKKSSKRKWSKRYWDNLLYELWCFYILCKLSRSRGRPNREIKRNETKLSRGNTLFNSRPQITDKWLLCRWHSDRQLSSLENNCNCWSDRSDWVDSKLQRGCKREAKIRWDISDSHITQKHGIIKYSVAAIKAAETLVLNQFPQTFSQLMRPLKSSRFDSLSEAGGNGTAS